MNALFYITSVIAVVSTFLVITSLNAVHALLYLIVSLLSVAMVFFLFGAPFAAALEVIIYAGAIMVIFVFVVMMLNLGPQTRDRERQWLKPRMWWGPSILAALLLFELVYMALSDVTSPAATAVTDPEAVSIPLFSSYLLGVELASLLLLAGLVGAYHLGRRKYQSLRSEEP